MCLHGGVSALRKMSRSSSDIYNLMHIILLFEHIHAKQNLFLRIETLINREIMKSQIDIESKS